MAPEVVGVKDAQTPYGEKIDVWSAGVMLSHLAIQLQGGGVPGDNVLSMSEEEKHALGLKVLGLSKAHYPFSD